MDSKNLDMVFSALSDATRRGILANLEKGEQSVHALTARFDISQPAISRHLSVLDRAGLISRKKRGRETIVRASVGSAHEASSWLSRYVAFWTDHFEHMETLLSEKKE